jgi:hypothetical protein
MGSAFCLSQVSKSVTDRLLQRSVSISFGCLDIRCGNLFHVTAHGAGSEHVPDLFYSGKKARRVNGQGSRLRIVGVSLRGH